MQIRREDTSLLRLPAATTDGKAATLGAQAGDAATAPRRMVISRVRTGMMSVFWLIGGAAVLGYGGTLVYANVARIEVESAVVSGTLQPVRAPAAGVLVSMPLQPGAAFAPGDRLFVVHNPETEQAISLASVRLDRARHDLLQREAERDAELVRRENYLIRARADIARIEEEVQALAEVERATRVRLDIMTRLFAEGLMNRLRLEDAAERAAEARSRHARERIRQEERRGLLEALENGYGYGAGDVVVRLADAEAAVRRATAEVEFAVEDLRVRMERRSDMAVRATAAGRVLRVIRLDGTHVLAGDTVAFIERDDDRLVYAFLTQAEVARVSLGDEADIMLPAQRLLARARVTAVERAGGYLDDVESRYRWNLSRDMGQRMTDRDRTARVALRFEGEDLAAARRVLDLGTPAVVSFERRWYGGPLFAAFEPMAGRGAARE